jgi:hypothetical protein
MISVNFNVLLLVGERVTTTGMPSVIKKRKGKAQKLGQQDAAMLPT